KQKVGKNGNSGFALDYSLGGSEFFQQVQFIDCYFHCGSRLCTCGRRHSGWPPEDTSFTYIKTTSLKIAVTVIARGKVGIRAKVPDYRALSALEISNKLLNYSKFQSICSAACSNPCRPAAGLRFC